MIHFYKCPKGRYINFTEIATLITSHDRSWIVDREGGRYQIGDPHDIPNFILFLNKAMEERNPCVSSADFGAYLFALAYEREACPANVSPFPSRLWGDGGTLPPGVTTKEEFDAAKSKAETEAETPASASKKKGGKNK